MLNPAKYRMSNEVMGETLDYGCLLQARQVIRQRVKAHHHIRSCIRWAITSSATAAGDNYFDDTLIMSRCPIQQTLNPAFQGRPKTCPSTDAQTRAAQHKPPPMQRPEHWLAPSDTNGLKYTVAIGKTPVAPR